MSEASNVYRKIDVGMVSTLSGSNVLVSIIFYKLTNPLGLLSNRNSKMLFFTELSDIWLI